MYNAKYLQINFKNIEKELALNQNICSSYLVHIEEHLRVEARLNINTKLSTEFSYTTYIQTWL